MAILTCPGCGRGGLRIPDGRRGKVTCPRCGAEWFYPETIELNEVEFRCSQTGARFVIQLSRRSPLHKFVVQGIKNAPPRPMRVDDGENPPTPKSTDEHHNAPSHRLTGPKPGRWLTRLFAKSALPVSSSAKSAPEHVVATLGASLTRYDANEYNWASFFCPYCRAAGFIKCAAGHLVCDGTVEMRNGRRFHQCFCGNAAFIEGTIMNYEANQRTIEQAVAASTNPMSATPASEALASPPDQGTGTPIKRLLR